MGDFCVIYFSSQVHDGRQFPYPGEEYSTQEAAEEGLLEAVANRTDIDLDVVKKLSFILSGYDLDAVQNIKLALSGFDLDVVKRVFIALGQHYISSDDDSEAVSKEKVDRVDRFATMKSLSVL